MNALQFVVDSFLQAKCDFTRNTAVLHFCAPFGGLRGNIFSRLGALEITVALMVFICSITNNDNDDDH